MAAKPFYNIINYRGYPEGTKVETFTRAAYELAGIQSVFNAFEFLQNKMLIAIALARPKRSPIQPNT